MITLDDGVRLLAPGGAWLPEARALVVADLHAGYVSTLQRRGYALPSLGDQELHDRLRGLLEATGAERVVVAGDLVHGRGALGHGDGGAPLDALLSVFAGCELVVVPGNHDRVVESWLAARGVAVEPSCSLGGCEVLHGDEAPEALREARSRALSRGGRLILGHLHPALSLSDGAGARARLPAFAHAPGLLCLPALTPLARGSDLRRSEYAEGLTALAPPSELSLSVVVGARVLPVGTLAGVRRASARG